MILLEVYNPITLIYPFIYLFIPSTSTEYFLCTGTSGEKNTHSYHLGIAFSLVGERYNQQINQ